MQAGIKPQTLDSKIISVSLNCREVCNVNCVSSNQVIFGKSEDMKEKRKELSKMESHFFLKNSKGKQEREVMINVSRNSQSLNFIKCVQM